MAFRAFRRIAWAASICFAVPRHRHLTGRAQQLKCEVAERCEIIVALARGLPRLGARKRGRLLAAGVRELEDPPAVAVHGADQLLVLELLERRVDRSRAGAPCPAGALGELLDDLVAMHRLLRQEGEDGRADVAAAGLSASAEELALEAGRPETAVPAAAPAVHHQELVAGAAAPAGVVDRVSGHRIALSFRLFNIRSRYIVTVHLSSQVCSRRCGPGARSPWWDATPAARSETSSRAASSRPREEPSSTRCGRSRARTTACGGCSCASRVAASRVTPT